MKEKNTRKILWKNREKKSCVINNLRKMSSDWRPLLNNYLTDFEARTTTALENINRLLLESGKTIDDRIKDYFMKSVRNR